MKNLFDENIGTFIGGMIGLIIAILILTINIWKTLLIVIFVLVGSFFGSKPEVRQDVVLFFTNIFKRK